MSDKKYYLVIRKVSCYVKAEDEDDACDLVECYECNQVLDIHAKVDYDVQEVSIEEAVSHDVIEDDEEEDEE